MTRRADFRYPFVGPLSGDRDIKYNRAMTRARITNSGRHTLQRRSRSFRLVYPACPVVSRRARDIQLKIYARQVYSNSDGNYPI